MERRITFNVKWEIRGSSRIVKLYYRNDEQKSKFWILLTNIIKIIINEIEGDEQDYYFKEKLLLSKDNADKRKGRN